MREVKQDNMYLVDEEGNVYSKFTKKLLKNSLAKNGYFVVNIRVNGKRKPVYIHRLVAEAFLEPDSERCFVNHKNGIKTDNRVENLEWVTDSENKKHAKETGLTAVGSKTNRNVLSEECVFTICTLLQEGWTSGEITGELGAPVTRSLVLNIRSRRDWKHVSQNYTWEQYPERRNKNSITFND